MFVKNGSLFQGVSKFIPDGIDSSNYDTSFTITASDILIATNSLKIDGNIIAENDLTIDGNGNNFKLKNNNTEIDIGDDITINSDNLIINQNQGVGEINITAGSIISQGVVGQFAFDNLTFGNDIIDQPSNITFSTSNSTKLEIYSNENNENSIESTNSIPLNIKSNQLNLNTSELHLSSSLRVTRQEKQQRKYLKLYYYRFSRK